MKKRWMLMLATLVVLSGCATLNKDECLTADWRAIGYEDGSAGQAKSRIGAHREACAKHGVTPDLTAYQMGHDEGLLEFCTARNGFRKAQGGYSYSGICPASLEGDFLEGYDAGREIYAETSIIKNTQNQQRTNEQRIDQMDAQLVEKEAELFAPTTTEDRRRIIYDEISKLNEQRGQLIEENKQLLRKQIEAEARLRILRERYSHF